MYHRTIFLLRQLPWVAVISLLTSNAIANNKITDVTDISSKQLKLAKEVI